MKLIAEERQKLQIVLEKEERKRLKEEEKLLKEQKKCLKQQQRRVPKGKYIVERGYS